MADIDGINPRRAAFQQDLTKPAGGGADIGGDAIGRINIEMIDGADQLVRPRSDPALLRGF